MNEQIRQILANVLKDPKTAASVVNMLLGLVGVQFVIDRLPAGHLKTYASVHPDEVSALLRELAGLVAQHADLFQAAAQDYGHANPH